jgi:hypothetical protein
LIEWKLLSAFSTKTFFAELLEIVDTGLDQNERAVTAYHMKLATCRFSQVALGSTSGADLVVLRKSIHLHPLLVVLPLSFTFHS